jgi:hypothetical protein
MRLWGVKSGKRRKDDGRRHPVTRARLARCTAAEKRAEGDGRFGG